MDWLLILSLGVVALLYASVGHAGASGYIAVMTLFGLAPETVRPSALILNIIVAAIAAWHFVRAGHFRASLFWPFAIFGAIPAFFGGAMKLPPGVFHVLVGCVLLASAARFLFWKPPAEPSQRKAHPFIAVAIGALLGLLAGLTGTGGGIFLTPVLLFTGWATVKQAAAISALFILVNSAAGLGGFVHRGGELPDIAWPMVVVVMVGGFIGARLGARQMTARQIGYVLAAVLVFAGVKLILI